MLASHGHLHVFEGERRVARYGFRELGLGAALADLDALPGGALLVADSDAKSLKLCRPEARRCSVFYDGTAQPGGEPRKAFKAAVEPGTGRVVLSDSSNHRLLLIDAQGRLRHSTPTNGPRFTFPNGIAFLARGELAVADTDHLRVAFVRLEGEGFAAAETELRTRRVFPGSDALHPIDVVAEPGGRLWTILANNVLEAGAVVAMQRDGSDARHVALPQPADPLSLVALDGAVLVLEPTTYRVSRVASNGGSVAPFGDSEFRQELESEAAWRARLLLARRIAQLLLVLGLIGALVVAVRSRTMRVFPQLWPKWQIPAAPTPLAADTDWIDVNPLPGGAVLIAYAAVALLAFAGLFAWLQSFVKATPSAWLGLELMLGILLAILLVLVVLVRRYSRGRLGVDGHTLFVDDAGRKLELPLADVLYSNTRLLARDYIVVLRLPAGDRYPSERVAGAILARVPASARLSEWSLDMTYLARRWRRLWPS